MKMKHLCDDCYTLHSGSVQEVPGRIMPTVPTWCATCTTASIGGIDVIPNPNSGLQFNDLVQWVPVPSSG